MSSSNKFDGKRGEKGTGGWWLSLEEAQSYVVGHEEWWSLSHVRDKVNVQQYPSQKPIWMYNNGDMYVGEWKYSEKRNRFVEHGVGATYIHNPPRFRGVVYVGGWKDGDFHGAARAFWLESSPTWIKNELGDTGIRQELRRGKFVSRPYSYIGTYVDNVETDERAVVSLKDGTTRIGPWEAGKPVGDWWTDHESVAAAPRQTRVVSATTTQSPTNNNVSRKKERRMTITPLQGKKRRPVVMLKTSRDHKKKKVKPAAAHRRSMPLVTPQRVAQSQSARDESAEQESSLVIDLTEPDEETSMHDVKEEKVVLMDQDREEEIAQWLGGVIGYNPNKEAMREYAKKFMELGLHSSQMISDLLPADRVSTFDWMKEFHKLQFSSNANLKR